MDLLHRHCAGIDVHKKSVVVCVRHWQEDGTVREEVRSFETSTRHLLALGDWLAAEQVTHAAMESTGVYWKPVWNLLEGRLALMLVNARHIKQVPGRKTDVKDCQWIAQLLGCGLLKPSFVPDMALREMRDLTRSRAVLVQERSRVASRIQKVLESANIKLASVASDILGASGRDMLQAMIDGQDDPKELAEPARHRLRTKMPKLQEALQGRVTDHHRFMLRQLLGQVKHLDEQIKAFDDRVEAVMSPLMKAAVDRLDTMPGVNRRAAEVIVSEIGHDMSRFPTAGHLASWAGLCPGNNESAGKRRSGRTTQGNRWLKRTLTQCAWAAQRTKNTYLASMHRRLAARRGSKRATLAIAHAQLRCSYEMLTRGQDYRDLGVDYFDRMNQERLTKQLVTRLTKLGHKVTLDAA
jgi:transposase